MWFTESGFQSTMTSTYNGILIWKLNQFEQWWKEVLLSTLPHPLFHTWLSSNWRLTQKSTENSQLPSICTPSTSTGVSISSQASNGCPFSCVATAHITTVNSETQSSKIQQFVADGKIALYNSNLHYCMYCNSVNRKCFANKMFFQSISFSQLEYIQTKCISIQKGSIYSYKQ